MQVRWKRMTEQMFRHLRELFARCRQSGWQKGCHSFIIKSGPRSWSEYSHHSKDIPSGDCRERWGRGQLQLSIVWCRRLLWIAIPKERLADPVTAYPGDWHSPRLLSNSLPGVKDREMMIPQMTGMTSLQSVRFRRTVGYCFPIVASPSVWESHERSIDSECLSVVPFYLCHCYNSNGLQATGLKRWHKSGQVIALWFRVGIIGLNYSRGSWLTSWKD